MPSKHLRALAGAAVWDLSGPAVIRPHRHGWLIFIRGRHAWYGTAEAADALRAGEHNADGIPIWLR